MRIHIRHGVFLLPLSTTLFTATDCTHYRTFVCLCIRPSQNRFCVYIPFTQMQPVPFNLLSVHTPYITVWFFAISALSAICIFYVQFSYVTSCTITSYLTTYMRSYYVTIHIRFFTYFTTYFYCICFISTYIFGVPQSKYFVGICRQNIYTYCLAPS
jgi:hypothetical protein